VLITYNFKVKPGTARKAAELVEEELSNSRKAGGCEDLQIYFDEEAGTLFLYERWESQKHVDEYLAYRARENRPNPLAEYLLESPVRRTFDNF
jgi:quinol monooxygenase YgiN